ncbi:MAG: ATP-dependent RecD-like DNA helicase [Clostridia bacterium]|nr:ATP-dependent RecD-like DNA helicase [Clostridia bacterium]
MSKFEGTVEDIVFRNNDNGWTVASVRLDGSGRLSAVGILPFLTSGEHAIFEGELVEHREYGQQIQVSKYTTTRPETESAIEKYLGSGLIRGIGKTTAKVIVRTFGARTLEIMESDPERLLEIQGIGRKRLSMILESFQLQNATRGTLMYLQGLGLSPQLSMKVYKLYGDMTEQALRENPYRLVTDVEGVGFKTADAIALAMGFSRECEFRLNSGVQYVLNEAVNSEGHTYLPRQILVRQAAHMLGAPEELVDHTIDSLYVRKGLRRERIGDVEAVYLPRLYDAELDTAMLLKALRRSIRPAEYSRELLEAELERFQAERGVQLCGEQREAVLAAAGEGVAVITGGPVTGKTTSINCILHLMKRMGQIELCAPTGRAAKRMSEATGWKARTIHRMLEYGGEGQGFARDEDNPLEADVVIVDEMSMVDLFVMRSLLRALKPGTRLVLVGDADQLPSVGAGNVLKDLIESEAVPVVRLTEIFRQAQESMIVMNAHRINRGEYPTLRARNTDFFIDRKQEFSQAQRAVVELVQTRLPGYLGVDSLRGIQVMAPMKRGDLGVFALNVLLQQALNPPQKRKPELRRGDTVFRMGDKVMQVRNDYDLEWEQDGTAGSGVFNGDIGYIRSVDTNDSEMTVAFDDGRVANYDSSMLEELELAYCMSVHKSQGSEFEAVVLPLLSGPPMLMTRNLLYTAVTRAKRLVVIVGREACVQRMVDNNRILQRYSALALRLSGALEGGR